MAARGNNRKDRDLLSRFWAWLTGTGYRPERHYMRGARVAHGAVTAS